MSRMTLVTLNFLLPRQSVSCRSYLCTYVGIKFVNIIENTKCYYIVVYTKYYIYIKEVFVLKFNLDLDKIYDKLTQNGQLYINFSQLAKD